MKFIGQLFIFVFLIWNVIYCQETADNGTETTNATEPSTTPVPITTTVPVTTTTESPIGNWTVHYGNGTICIMVQMDAHLVLQYNTTDGTAERDLFLDPAIATVVMDKSSCESGILALEFNKSSLQLKFGKNDKKISLVNITLDVTYDNVTFPNASTSHHTYSATNQVFFEASEGSSYLCNSNADLPLSENSKIAVKDVQVEAFAMMDSGKFSSAEECQTDEGDVSDIVPIAVGCALAGLVVIVLIAYLVGRRHKRQKGYESV